MIKHEYYREINLTHKDFIEMIEDLTKTFNYIERYIPMTDYIKSKYDNAHKCYKIMKREISLSSFETTSNKLSDKLIVISNFIKEIFTVYTINYKPKKDITKFIKDYNMNHQQHNVKVNGSCYHTYEIKTIPVESSYDYHNGLYDKHERYCNVCGEIL